MADIGRNMQFLFFCFLFLFCYNNIILAILQLCFLTEFTPSYSLTHNGDDAPQNCEYICSGCFIMFSVFTKIDNKETKGPTLMELFTATGKLKKRFFFYNYRCSMCAPRVTRHTSIRYSSSRQTRVNMGASIVFTAAMIRAFRSARSRGNVLCALSTKCTLHSNHRLTRVTFQPTKLLLPRSGHFLITDTRIAQRQKCELR